MNSWLLSGFFIVPFLSFIINKILYKRKNILWARFFSLSSVLILFVLSCVLFLRFYLSDQLSIDLKLFSWLLIKGVDIDFAISVLTLVYFVTMATAGVYVLFRLNGLLDVSFEAMLVVAFFGILTAFIAAVAALIQQDIKKILAYSTVPQLGYMILAIGLGSYVSAVFHLVTHVFFKSLMFLGAGVVIRSLSGEQNIEKMGD